MVGAGGAVRAGAIGGEETVGAGASRATVAVAPEGDSSALAGFMAR
jgi:hypothetical protein